MTTNSNNHLLIQARHQLKLSQQKVADLINVPQRTYHNWESGKTKISVTKITLLAKILQIEVTHLLS